MAHARSFAQRTRRRGLTLVEMLVAMTCTILLMLAITQTFQNIGDVSSKGRAAIEMSTQLRGVQRRLQEDLQSLTVPVRPWPDAGSGLGYFEYYEGPTHDSTNATSNSLLGDGDDVLAFTIKTTPDKPFTGRIRGQLLPAGNGRYTVTNYGDENTTASNVTFTTIQSTTAEVVWWVSHYSSSSGGSDTDNDNAVGNNEGMLLHRRVLLIRPDIDYPQLSQAMLNQFWQDNDVSARPVTIGGQTRVVTNTLADLTLRENRFAHNRVFPGTLQTTSLNPGTSGTGVILSGDRRGEDVILSNVMAFDVRAFDRQAVVRATSSGEAVAPRDPGYNSNLTAVTYGAFVDLFHASGAGEFASAPHAKSALGSWPTYDTWSYTYEHDGVNQDNDAVTDEGVDGIDNDNNGIVDDIGERETAPPYPVPLRAVQVRLRVIEHQTRQVRQATVVQDFIPE